MFLFANYIHFDNFNIRIKNYDIQAARS
jgi:hypothetical protein